MGGANFARLALALFVALTSLLAPTSASARPLIAAVPSVALAAPSSVFIGDSFDFTVTFDNTDTDTGYGPFIDLVFPVNGADGVGGLDADGIDFVDASYLGLSLTSDVQTFPDDDGAGPGTTGCVDHPYARDTSGDPLQVCGQAGDKLVVLLLPFGSFTPGQPPLAVTVSAQLSDQADVGTGLALRARGGFQFGTTALDDWCCDPVIVNPTTDDGSGWPNVVVTPTVITLSKTSDAPEQETATGPNFPRSYTISVDVASGQTVTDLDVIDDLDENIAYLGASTSGTIVDEPTVGSADDPPDNRLLVNFASLTGGPGADATITVDFFVPDLDAGNSPVIDPNSGDDSSSANEASAIGDWTPLDGGDPGGTDNAVADEVGPEHTLSDRSLAIQKTDSIVNDMGASGLSPADILEYTLEFQISDFFTFGDLIVSDTFSDGQRFVSAFAPTLSVTDREGTVSGSFVTGTDLTVDTSEIGNDLNPITDGSTTLIFDVSAAIDRLGGDDGILQGGRAVAPDEVGAVGTIRFQTEVQDVFSDTYPSGDESVDQGDTLENDVEIAGTVRDNADIDTILEAEEDDSGTTASIGRGTLTKTIYAVNGDTSFASPPQVAPSDTVTYRVQYTLPTTDLEELSFVDYLPLPVFDATEMTNFDAGLIGSIPPAGTATFGPADSFFSVSGIVPGLTTSGPAAENSVTFNYGNYDDDGSVSTVVDLLFTVTVTNEPFADGLFLTNQARASEGSTNAGDQAADSIVQIQIQEPLLVMTKGTIATSNPNGSFSPGTTGPVAFSAPGSANPRWSGTIDSNGLGGQSVDSDLADVDAGDLVSFGIVIENQGSSPAGAFDIQLQDELPPGFEIPGSGDNLSVTRGDGTVIDIVEPGTATPADIDDLFAGGIELVDPDDEEGACQGYSDDSGRNIVVITYDLAISDSVAPGQEIPNIATVTNYASENGGEDFTGDDSDLTDDALVTIAAPDIDKTFAGTNQAHTLGQDVAIGEQVSYSIEVTVPEGASPDVGLVDTLELGLAFVSVDSISGSAGVTTDQGTFADVANGAVFSAAGAGPAADGRVVTLDFGTVTNSNRDNSTPETMTIETTAVVINSDNNDRGQNLTNDAEWSWTVGGESEVISASAADVTVVEPEIQVEKSADPTMGDAGDTITFTLTVSHAAASDADAFELELLDTIPTAMTYVGSSLTNTAGVAPTTTDDSGGTISATWDGLAQGETSELQFQVTLNSSVAPGEVIENTGEIQWTSLPGDETSAQTPNNSLSVERTGDTADVGGSANDHSTSGSAEVTIFSQPTKSIAVTSESHTGIVGSLESVAIGEIVRYRLEFRQAEGTAQDFQLQDRLPAGLQFIDDGTAMVALVANDGGISSSTLSGSGLSVSGNETNLGSITPTYVLPDAAVSNSPTSDTDSYGSGTNVYFKLGNLTNDDRDDDQEFVVVEFNAIVMNVGGNQAYNNATGGTTTTNRGNAFRPRIDGTNGQDSNTVRVRIAEPLINNLDKSLAVTPADADDAVQYTLTFGNTSSGFRAAAAFDIQVLDTLESNLSLTGVSISAPGYATVTDASSAPQVDVSISRLDPGDSVTVTIDAEVVPDVPVGVTISNSADLTYTSLPGANGTSGNPTGSSSGTAGSASGERTGSDGAGGLNDYVDTDSIDLNLDDPAVSKSISATSVASTESGEFDLSIVDLVIGEEVTFQILVTLPEGTAVPLVVSDNLPTIPPQAGILRVVSSSLISVGGNLSALPAFPAPGPFGVISDSDADTIEDQVVFDFGDVTNAPDNASDVDDQIVLQVVARVENVTANQNGDVLTNNVTADAGGETGSASAQVELVEPELGISKVAVDETPALGETFSYQITVSHLPGSTADAEDVVVSDTIPAGLSYVASSASAPAGWSVNDSGAPTLVFSGSLTQTDASALLSYQVTVDNPPSANVGDVFSNTADLEWTSIPGADGNERDGSGGVDNYSSSANESVTVTGIDLTLTKSDGGISAAPGEVIVYSLAYSNVGNAAAGGVEISETVPDSTTFDAGSSEPGWTCTPDASAGSSCLLSLGTLDAGDSGTADFAVQVVDPAPAGLEQIENQASITDDGSDGPEPTPDNNSDGDTTPVIAAPDLAVSKDDGLSVVSDGTVLTYTMIVENLGDQDATGVKVTDDVPANTTFQPAGSSSEWSCAPDENPGATCLYDLGPLAAGDNVTLTFQLRIDSPLPAGVEQISNTVTVEDDGANGDDTNPDDNQATDTDNVATDANTDLTKALAATNRTFSTGSTVAIGEILTYQLVLTAPAGTMEALGVQDTLDRGLAFVECESIVASAPTEISATAGTLAEICAAPTVETFPSGSGNPADEGRLVRFDFGDLTNTSGEDQTVTIRYQAAALDSSENVRGTSLGNAVEADWVGDGLTAQASEVTLAEPSLALAKSVEPRVVMNGGLVTFRLRVEHAGESNLSAFDLVLEDELPSELVYEPGTLVWNSVGSEPDTLEDSAAPLLVMGWDSFPVGSESEVEFSARLTGVSPGQAVANEAFLEWSSLPGDVSAPQSDHNDLSTERFYDPGSPIDIYGVSASATVRAPRLPATGFAPGRTTEIEAAPSGGTYRDLGAMRLNVEDIGLDVPIVGVPTDDRGWDLTWLSDEAGYLEGTAFPGLPGNTALTGHIYLADGRPGPFHRLRELAWGDRVILEAGGSRYTYEVRQVRRVWPHDLSVLRHEEYDWLTLITCENYDAANDRYRHRLAVRAVLVEVEPAGP